MDRFTAAGIALDAAIIPNRRIAVVAPRQQEARQALEAVASLGDLVAHAKARRANGEEQIRFDNGSVIIFRSARQSLRGRRLNVIFVHPDIPRHVLGERAWADWRRYAEPCLIMDRGELILGW